MAPVFSLMEVEVLKKMREMIGWSDGNGIFAPGGSISNLYGLTASRYHKFPDSKAKGCVHLPQQMVFASSGVRSPLWLVIKTLWSFRRITLWRRQPFFWD